MMWASFGTAATYGVSYLFNHKLDLLKKFCFLIYILSAFFFQFALGIKSRKNNETASMTSKVW